MHSFKMVNEYLAFLGGMAILPWAYQQPYASAEILLATNGTAQMITGMTRYAERQLKLCVPDGSGSCAESEHSATSCTSDVNQWPSALLGM